MRSRQSELRTLPRESRLPHWVAILLVGLILMLPTAAGADDQAVPAVVPFAENPQVGSGNSFSAPFQWYKVNLTSGDSLAATAGPTNTLNYAPGTGGSMEGSATQVVPTGSDGTTVTAVPGPWYRFVGWSDGFPRATRRDIVVDSDVSVTAEFSKLITQASIARTPNKSKVTYARRGGIARFALSAVIMGWGAQPLAGRYVYLQTSTNGKTWKSTYKIKTSTAGKASKSLKVKTKQVRYYRWYVPATSQVNLKTYGAATKVTVK